MLNPLATVPLALSLLLVSTPALSQAQVPDDEQRGFQCRIELFANFPDAPLDLPDFVATTNSIKFCRANGEVITLDCRIDLESAGLNDFELDAARTLFGSSAEGIACVTNAVSCGVADPGPATQSAIKISPAGIAQLQCIFRAPGASGAGTS